MIVSGTGVTFGTNHSYKAWGLKLKEIKIGLPEVKTSYVEVPGMNGSLDLAKTYGSMPDTAMMECNRFGKTIFLTREEAAEKLTALRTSLKLL